MAKVRIEYVRLASLGRANTSEPEVFAKIAAAGESVEVAATSVQSAAAPSFAAFGSFAGGVYAMITCVDGAVVVTGPDTNPTATQVNGIRIQVADAPKLFEVIEGQKFAFIESEDAPAGVGGDGGTGGGGDASSANQGTQIALETSIRDSLGLATEATPATTATGPGINAFTRMLIDKVLLMSAKLPATLGIKGDAASFSVTFSTELQALFLAMKNGIESVLPSIVKGETAHDAAIGTTVPFVQGFRAGSTAVTAVGDGDVVYGRADLKGRPVVVLGQVRELKGDDIKTISASTAAATLIAAGGAGVINDITGVWFTNTDATIGTEVIIYNDDGVTERASIWVPPKETRGAILPGQILKGAAANVTWKWKTATSVPSAVKATVFFNKET